MKNFLSNFFLILSFLSLLFGLYLIQLRYSPRKLAFNNLQYNQEIISKLYSPTELIIKSANIHLPVISAKIVNNTWETTDKGASYLASSAEPGKTGNSVFYGHNWTSLLGNLPRVKPGDSVQVVMNNGERRNFRVEYTAIVTPDQTQIIEQTYDKRVTIYTCTGFLDSKRFVVVAKTI